MSKLLCSGRSSIVRLTLTSVLQYGIKTPDGGNTSAGVVKFGFNLEVVVSG